METDDRIRTLELGQARTEEQVHAIKHDTSNIRLMVNASAALSEAGRKQIGDDVKALSKTLLGIGLSVLGTLFTLMISALVYFVSQKMETVTDNHDRITKIERKVGP